MNLKVFFYCILSSILLWLSFPNFNLGCVAWFGFVPLFFAVENQTKISAFWLSYLYGFIFFLLTIYWLAYVTLAGLILLCLYLAFYFAFFGYFFVGFKRRAPQFNFPLVVFLSSLWVILEYLRSQLLTGFPWALLGYSQHLNIYIIQFVDITGSLGVSFLVIFVNLCLLEIIKSLFAKNYKIVLRIFLILFFIFVAIYGYGIYSIKKYSSFGRQALRISLIQGNVSQSDKWLVELFKEIKENYSELTRGANKDNPDLIIWPETSYPDFISDKDQEALFSIEKIVSEIKRPILFGGVYQSKGDYFNSAFLIPRSLRPITIYKKIHLVPFGEYIPLRKYFFFLEKYIPIIDFGAGEEFVLFRTENSKGEAVRFGVLICFEDTLSELSRRLRLKGADFLVNITNDAWFLQTSSPYQHLQASVFRAVENRVYLVRAANTGISCIIDNCGRVIQRVRDEDKKDIFVRGFITGNIKKQGVLSFYTRFGDLFVLSCIIYVFLFVIYVRKKL